MVIEVSWSEIKIVHLQTILNLTGIPIIEGGIQNPVNIGDYIFLMGDHCTSPQEGGISAKSVYQNAYASYRWLYQNVLGV